MKVLMLAAGAVVSKTRVHGVSTPYNASIVNLIKFREALAIKGAIS